MFHEEHMQAHRRRWKAMSAGKKVLVIAGWIVLIAGGLALFGLVVMLLWNRIMSGVLGLPCLRVLGGGRSLHTGQDAPRRAPGAFFMAGCG